MFLDSPSARLHEKIVFNVSHDPIQWGGQRYYDRFDRGSSRPKIGFDLQWRRQTVSHGLFFSLFQNNAAKDYHMKIAGVIVTRFVSLKIIAVSFRA